MSNYVSEDKMVITLPIPLGTTLYEIVTTCGDFCYFQEDKFNEIYPKELATRCNRDMPCHTRLHSIKPIEFNLSNIETVLKDFNKWIFTTEDEAKQVAEKIIEKNRKEMLLNGFYLKSDGYGTFKKEFNFTKRKDSIE